MDKYIDFLIEVIQEAALLFTYGGLGVALIVGLWMLFHPTSLFRLNELLSRWFSTRKAMKPLTTPIKSEPFIYHHHRLFGFFILLGAGYVLYTLVFRFSGAAFLQAVYGSSQPVKTVAWFVDALVIVLALTSILALIVGIYLFIRPSLLKGVESWSNKWITLRKPTKVFDVLRTGPEPFITSQPRIIAVIIILGSAYALFGLSQFI